MDGVIYYPYINVPDSAWFTRAALYWDTVGTIVPDEWTYTPERLGAHTLELVQRGIITQFLPSYADLTSFAERFAGYVNGLQQDEVARRRSGFNAGETERIHQDKGPPDVFHYLMSLGLCAEDSGWWRVELKTSSDYMAGLALALSLPDSNILQLDPWSRNSSAVPEAMHVVPITDQPHSLLPLLTGTVGITHLPLMERAEGQSIIGRVQAMVLESLFPAPVTAVAPAEIERFRNRHAGMLPEFRRHVEQRVDEIFNLSMAWQRRRALDRLESEFKQAIGEVKAYMSESKFGKVARSPWTALIGIIPGLDRATAAAKAAADIGDPAPASPKSVLAYAAFASVELSRHQRRPRRVSGGSGSLIGTAMGQAS
jgi:hypothetical protein